MNLTNDLGVPHLRRARANQSLDSDDITRTDNRKKVLPPTIAFSNNCPLEYKLQLGVCVLMAVSAPRQAPGFPHESLASELAWVPAFIDSMTPNRARDISHKMAYDFLLNIVLVFSRARASALVALYPFQPPAYKVIIPFVKGLNSNGKCLRLEIFRYDRRLWFITTKCNPRFIRQRRLTHREIGINLDCFAPGHLFFDEISN